MFNKFTGFIEISGNKYIYNLHTGAIDLLEDNFSYEKFEKELDDRLYLDTLQYNKYCKQETEADNIFFCNDNRIYIALNNFCNARCSYCFENTLVPQNYNCDVESIIENLNKYDNLFDVTLYGGEPLLEVNYIYLEKILDYLKERSAKVNIITNGYNIDLYSEILIKYLDIIDKITISMDGNRVYHDNIKGIGFYDKIFKNLRSLTSLKICVNFRLNLSKINKMNFFEFVDDVNKLKFDNITITIVGIKYCRDSLSLKEIYEIYEQLNFRLHEHVSAKISNLYINRIIMMFSDEHLWIPLRMCDETKVRTVTDKGVYICNETLFNENFEEINYERMENITMSNCEKCKFEMICGRGCMMLNRFHGGIYCIYKEIEEFISFYLQKIIEGAEDTER